MNRYVIIYPFILVLAFMATFGVTLVSMPSEAEAFGYNVRHVMYRNEQPELVVNEEKRSLDLEIKIRKEMEKQVGLTHQMRSSLGDTRIMFEKDRLIETIKDYDTIMRSLLYFQTRNKDLLNKNKNKNFAYFQDMIDNQLNAATASSATTEESSAPKIEHMSVLRRIFNNPVSYFLRAPNSNNTVAQGQDILKAGNYFGEKHFIHAYTFEDKKRVPADMKELVTVYRTSLLSEVAVRNYLLGMYARAYLAERALGNGVGRYLYGNNLVVNENDMPWASALNIIGGLLDAAFGVFNSALQGVTGVFTGIVGAVTGTGTPASPSSTSLCRDLGSRELTRNCIWEEFIGNTHNGDMSKEFAFSLPEKQKQYIGIQNIRQFFSLNTIMWIRASLEVSTLILLTTAQMEMEAITAIANLEDSGYWIAPDDPYVWGKDHSACAAPEDPTQPDDGTRWEQNCLSEQEKKWLTPSFDWNQGKYFGAAVGATGSFLDDFSEVDYSDIFQEELP